MLTMAEVQAMIDMAVRPLQHQIDELHSINRRLLTMTEDLSIQMRHVRNEVRELREQPSATSAKPIDPHQTLPPVAEITRLEVQYSIIWRSRRNRRLMANPGEELLTSS